MSYRDWLLRPVLTKLEHLIHMATITAQDIQAVTEQVAKIGQESALTLAKVAELQAALDAAVAGQGIPADVLMAFDALKAQVGRVDDLIPDAPAA